jgi:hypothetical protein
VQQFDELRAVIRANTHQEELRRLRLTTGGIPLAYSMMYSSMVPLMRIIYVVELGSWDWYTHQTKKVKTPQQGLSWLLRTAKSWMGDDHFRNTLRETLGSYANLDWIGIGVGDQSDKCKTLATRMVKLMTHLLGQRVLGQRDTAKGC